jgi:IS605 OrfB family transposase
MISRTLKLRLNRTQERELERWLWQLTGVYNWAIRKIELDADDGIYHSKYDLYGMISGHSRRVGLPSKTMEMTVRTAYRAWRACFDGRCRKPRLKGNRNRLNSIPFRRSMKVDGNKIRAPLIGWMRFHAQDIPYGRIVEGRILKRSSGWYFSIVIDAEPNEIPHESDEVVGIDPGFNHLLTLSSGEKIEHPRELEEHAERIAQAQRGGNRKLVARLRERNGNRRKDRNHKLSRSLVARHRTIVWSRDSHRAIARSFGKSVSSSAHGQLREMISYKCRSGGREFIEVSPYKSTMTCSACGAQSGPTGWAGLLVRQWECADCGSAWDRDINAAINTLLAGLGSSHESAGDGASETA